MKHVVALACLFAVTGCASPLSSIPPHHLLGVERKETTFQPGWRGDERLEYVVHQSSGVDLVTDPPGARRTSFERVRLAFTVDRVGPRVGTATLRGEVLHLWELPEWPGDRPATDPLVGGTFAVELGPDGGVARIDAAGLVERARKGAASAEAGDAAAKRAQTIANLARSFFVPLPAGTVQPGTTWAQGGEDPRTFVYLGREALDPLSRDGAPTVLSMTKLLVRVEAPEGVEQAPAEAALYVHPGRGFAERMERLDIVRRQVGGERPLEVILSLEFERVRPEGQKE